MKRGSLNQRISTCILVVAMCVNYQSKAQIISTIAGNGAPGYKGEGIMATKAEINGQTGAAMDRLGNLFVTDFNNNRIRKISTTGVITTIAGTENSGYTGDGGPATVARLSGPSGIVVDAAGVVYFADRGNNCVRKIGPDGIISTIAGTGEASGGYSGNGGPAIHAKLQGPGSLAMDAAGNLYISDCDNNCVRKVNTAGIITLYAGSGFGAGTGTGDYSGDGGAATAARLNQPSGIALDQAGNLYIADCFNHCIRKVNTKGIISTIAGNRQPGFTGDAGRARLAEINYPYGVAADAKGNIYISDHGNNRIRMVNKEGIISTIAGNGNADYSGDGGQAAASAINEPTFVYSDRFNNLFIGDNANNRIRYIELTPTLESATTSASFPTPKACTSHSAASNLSASSSVSAGQ